MTEFTRALSLILLLGACVLCITVNAEEEDEAGIIRISEGGSFHLDDWDAGYGGGSTKRSALGPDELTALTGSCLHAEYTEHDDFVLCPFRNVTWGFVNARRARMGEDDTMDETVAGYYAGWEKSFVLPSAGFLNTQTEPSPVDAEEVEVEVEVEVEAAEDSESSESSGSSANDVHLVQVYDNGHYCRLGSTYSAVVEFECNAETREEEPGVDFSIKSVRQGEFTRQRGAGSPLGAWEEDSDGCTTRVTLTVPFSCDALGLIGNSKGHAAAQAAAAAATAARRAGDAVEVSVEGTSDMALQLQKWDSWGVRTYAPEDADVGESESVDVDIDSDADADSRSGAGVGDGSCECCEELQRLKLQLRDLAEALAESALSAEY